MATITITGTINGVNNTALANKWITFRLVQLGTDSAATATVAQSVDSVQTDANGDFSIDVWNNGDSGKPSVLEITVDGSKAENVIIPTGTASIELWDLIENYQADGSTSEQIPVVSSLFLRKSNNLSELTPTSSTARTNLGVAIGSDVQAHNAILDATTASFTTAKETAISTNTTDIALKAPLVDPAFITTSQGLATINNDAILTDFNLGLDVQAHSAILDGTTASFTTADETKLDGIEALADVTDPTNIIAAGGYITGTTVVPIADGGTGASDAPTARANLGFRDNVSSAVTAVGVTSYTVLSTDSVLTVDDTAIGGNVTINLPSAATLGSGWTLDVKRTGSTFLVTIDPDGTETIDNNLTLSITDKNQSVRLISDGSNWKVLSPHSITGWAIYDDAASHATPVAVNNTKTQLTIDKLGATTETSYLPANVTSLWDSTANIITPEKLGDAYDIRIDFEATPTNVNDYANLIIDVGDGGSIPIVNRSITFVKTGISSFSVGFPISSMTDFLTNGGKIFFDTSVSGSNVSVSNIVLFIKRDFSTL